MQPLIDSDILKYELGFAAKVKGEYMGISPPPFYLAEGLLRQRIQHICDVVRASSPPIMFFSGDSNFRNDIAKRRKYKDRPSHKPELFNEIEEWLNENYECRYKEGLEADDLMAIEQTLRPEETIICSRDKDLRQVAGWHFGWELYNQPQFGPEKVEEHGWISYDENKKILRGTGNMFLYSQIVMGDTIDSIPGIRNYGPRKTYSLLQGCNSERELYEKVFGLYRDIYSSRAEEEFMEQANLLYLIRKLDDEGNPIYFSTPS